MRKCGIMHNMKTKITKIAMPLAAVVVMGGSVACADTAQNAAVCASCIPPPCYQQSSVTPHKAGSGEDADPRRVELRGRVVRVADGDTITVLDAGNNQHKIRLYGTDAPEKSQAFGQKSKERLSGFVGGGNVTVTYKSKDRYDRILGTVFADSVNVNLQMLRDCFAWHYRRYDKTPSFSPVKRNKPDGKRLPSNRMALFDDR